MKVFSWLALVAGEVITSVKIIEADASNDLGFITIIALIISGIGGFVLMYFLTEESEWIPPFATIVSYLVFLLATIISYYLIIILIVVGVIWFLIKLGGSDDKKYKKTGQIDIYEED